MVLKMILTLKSVVLDLLAPVVNRVLSRVRMLEVNGEGDWFEREIVFAGFGWST